MYIMGFFGNKNSEKLEEYEKKMEEEQYQKWKQEKEDKDKEYQKRADVSYEKWTNNKKIDYYEYGSSNPLGINDIWKNSGKSEQDIGSDTKPRRISDVNDVDPRKTGYPSQSKYSVKWDTNEKIDSDLTKDKNQDAIDRGC